MIKGFTFDTSALISLGHTNLIQDIVENFEVNISKRIIEELKAIAQHPSEDEDAKAAKRWLRKIDQLIIHETKERDAGEDELFDLCKKNKMFLVSDDIKAIRKFRSEIHCYYSVHIVYILNQKGIITAEHAISSLERMRHQREWRNNVLSATAITLFKKE